MNMKKVYNAQRKVVKDRRWEKFHNPKNLVMALSGEVGELTELFQWVTSEESVRIVKDAKKLSAIRHEIGDVFYYLARLCDVLKIDLEDAFWEKLEISKKKYPVTLAKGSAKKYTEFTKEYDRTHRG